MTARRLVLAWCWGSVCGLVVGWVYGSHVQRLTEAHRLAEDYRRNEGAPMSAERRARLMAYRPARTAVRVPEPREGAGTGTSATPATNGPQTGAQPSIPTQRDAPCPQYSPGGGIPCSVTGTHTAHIFLGSCARDAKDVADERIE